MTIILNNFLPGLTYLLLSLSLISVWVTRRHFLWILFLTAGFITGLLTNTLKITAVLPVILMLALSWGYYKKESSIYFKTLCGVLYFLSGIGLFLHIFPGFNNWKVISNVVLSKGSIPYNMYLNFDKPLVALSFFVFGQELIRDRERLKQVIVRALPIAIIGIFTVMCFAYLFSYIKFYPKFPEETYIWMFSNLFLTCMAEEAFFRGFIQTTLIGIMSKIKGAEIMGLILASVLFGIAHYAGGILYVVLASIAGLFYGLVYLRTASIEASILTHFLVNTTHFLLFTYPAKA